MSLILRPATQADKAQVVQNQIASQNEEANLHPSRQRGEDIAGMAWDMINARQGLILVAELDGKIVGHVGGAHAMDSNPFLLPQWHNYSLIFDLYVMPQYRRQKIGCKLVQEMLRYLQVSGARNIRIIGLANNPAALALYQAAGFNPYEITLEKQF